MANLLDKSKFPLDSSGIAGIFGGDEAINAMATTYVYWGRKWLGWYNSPGSYNIAKRYGQLASGRFWHGLFAADKIEAVTLFGLDGKKGPMFKGFCSGISVKTGHIGSLLVDECEKSKDLIKLSGRQTKPVSVTVVNLGPSSLPIFPVKLLKSKAAILSFIPILFSLGCCIACGVFLDWDCFSMILLGIVTSGLSCLTIGSGDLFFAHPRPADGSPRGDGFMRSNNGIVILLGDEGAVRSVTMGRFMLLFARNRNETDLESCNNPKFSSGNMDRKIEPEYIGVCSMLLVVQFLAQLILVPPGTLFGQILFLSSLAVSWMYNQYLSSHMNKIQGKLLMREVLKGTTINRYLLGNWINMAVFALLVANPPNPRELLNDLVPIDTRVWKTWKEWLLNNLGENVFDRPPSPQDLDHMERKLLSNLVQDSKDALAGFSENMRQPIG